MSDPVLVVAAAIRYSDGLIHTMPPPARHHTLIRALSEGYGRTTSATEQGFMLSNGQWASRKDAYIVAMTAGQIKADHETKIYLFSEDLW